MKPPYKSPNNNWYTKALFWEQNSLYNKERQPIEPIFTLSMDKPGLINGRKTFVELGDPSGYKWAMTYLGDWEHWTVLMKCSWFKVAYEEWLEELNSKIQAEAVERIREIAQSDDKQALIAAKWLASKPWTAKTPARGRPSKEEVAGELKRQTLEKSVEDEDAKRIGLRVVK